MRVKCYYNLRKQCLSIVSKGKVIDHTTYIYLRNVEFKVSEAGRQRVLRERQKNVHAYIVGDIVDGAYPLPANNWTQVSYNPYKAGNFYYRVSEHPIYAASEAIVDGKNVYTR